MKQEKQLFVIKNNFLMWVVKKVLKKEKEKIHNRNNGNKIKHTVQIDAQLQGKAKSCSFPLPSQGEKCLHLTKSLKRKLKSLLNSTVKENIGFTGKNSAYIFN